MEIILTQENPPVPPLNNREKLLGVTWAMTALNLVLVFASSFLVVKVYKLVQFQDMPLLLSIISITLSLICFFCYNTMQLVRTIESNYYYGWDEYFLNTGRGVNLILAVDQLKVMFTFCAFVFDLYKWCVFIVATSQTVKSSGEEGNEKKQRLMVRILYIVQIIIIGAFLFFFFSISLFNPISDSIKNVKLASRYFIITMFAIFLVVYTFVLVFLSRRLKKYFPKFYEKEHLKIFLTTGIIILAIVSRITVNTWLINHLQDIEDSLNNGDWLYPGYQLITCLFATFFPLAATVVSLLYALS